MFKDIVARRRSEQSEAEPEPGMRRAFQVAPVAMGIVSNHRIRDINNCFCSITGYSREELIGKNTSILHPTDEDYEYVTGENFRQIKEQGTSTLETRFVSKDGHIIDVLLSSSPLNTTDLSAGITFTALDITERKLTEGTQKEKEKRYRRILQTATDGFMMTDSDDGRLIEVNDAYCKMSGYTKEELLSMKIWDLVASETLEEIRLRGTKIMDQGGDWFETQHRKKDGSTLDLEVSIKFYPDDKRYIFSFLREITEQKQAEMEWEKLQAQLANAVEIAHLGSWEYNVAEDLFTFNDQFYRIFRTTAEEVGGYRISSEEYARRFVHPDDIHIVGETIKKNIESKDPNFVQRLEHRILYTDGSVGYISVIIHMVKDSQGNTVRTYGVNQDITEQKQAELEKERQQALLSNAMGIANLAPWEFDVAKNIFIFNDDFYRLFRTTAEDVGGYEMSPEEFARRFVHPDDIHLFKGTIEEDKSPGQGIKRQIERHILYGDGTAGYISIHLLYVKDSRGKTIRIYGATQDITERKQAEIEREKLQAQLSNALEIANLAPWEYDVAEDLFILNDHFYRAFHTTAEEVGGYTMSSEEHARHFVHPDDNKGPLKDIVNQIDPESGNLEEHRTLFNDGTVGYTSVKMLVSRDSQGKVVRAYGVNQNITEQKQAEMEREKLQAQLSNAVEIANLAPWEYDVASDLFTFNDIFYKIFRTTAEEVGGYEMSSEEFARRFFHPDEFRTFKEKLHESNQGRDTDEGKRFEHKVIYGDGSVGYISVIPFIVKDNEGKTVHTYGATQDITEQKLAEIEREKLQALLSDALERANLAPWEFEVASDLFTFNDHFYNLFHTTAEEVGGYEMSSEEYARRFVHPDDMHIVAEAVRKAVDSKDPDFNQQMEHRIIYGDGTVGSISVKVFVVKDSQGKTIRTYGVNQDITEQKRMEEELLRTQKLESIGLLAGGIAHDFNNILTTILGNTYMAKMEVDPEHEIFELLSEMETASSRAQTLTQQLLTFAKGGAPVKEASSIKEVVMESSIFVLRGSKSSCEFSIVEDLWPVDVDVGQISQVINNIVMNANQAMPDGGKIRVAIENLTVEGKHGLPIKPGRYARISITDQGKGIAKEDLTKVFDPFFTTKPEGSGLGLAMVYSIIKKHDGHIRVESELGEGTTFQIYLPASERRAHKREEGEIIPGTGRILVMDDEAPLRRMVGRMLKKLGYDPEFAEEGAEAIETFRAANDNGKVYDAVILDLTVPGGMGGKDAVKKILEIEPEAKVIVSSGYSEDLVLSDFRQYGFKGILPKPYEPQSMSKVLHEVLQGKTKP